MRITVRNMLKADVFESARIVGSSEWLDSEITNIGILVGMDGGKYIKPNSLLIVSANNWLQKNRWEYLKNILVEQKTVVAAVHMDEAIDVSIEEMIAFCNSYSITVILMPGYYDYAETLKYLSTHIYIAKLGRFMLKEDIIRIFVQCLQTNAFGSLAQQVYKFVGKTVLISIAGKRYYMGSAALAECVDDALKNLSSLPQSASWEHFLEGGTLPSFSLYQSAHHGEEFFWICKQFLLKDYYLILIESDGKFTEEDLEVFRYASIVCELQTGIYERQIEEQSKRGRSVMRRLLFEPITPGCSALMEIENFGWSLGSRQIVAVLQCKLSQNQLCSFSAWITNRLEHMKKISSIPLYPLEKHIVLIFSDMPDAASVAEIITSACAACGESAFLYGVGGETELVKLGASYQQAVVALDYARYRQSDKGALYQKIGVERLLFQQSEDELTMLALDRLGPLLEYDKGKKTDLLPTLVCYLENGRNYAVVAETMHLHINSVRYRMRQIEDILCFDCRDAAQLMTLQTAYLAYSIANWRKGMQQEM